jgi:ketosteroid isomerase-like protein
LAQRSFDEEENRMKLLVFVLSAIGLLDSQAACYGDGQNERAETKREPGKQYTQETINVDRPSSKVDISSYVLITADLEADRADAEAIMRLRAKLPQAVQTKDAALFDRILARGFTFRAADEFWNREQYIRARVKEPETVGAARYENLVLQLFGDVAVSTYRNIVQLTDPSGKPETLYMTWASVYVKEDREWKIGAVHMIDKKSHR